MVATRTDKKTWPPRCEEMVPRGEDDPQPIGKSAFKKAWMHCPEPAIEKSEWKLCEWHTCRAVGCSSGTWGGPRLPEYGDFCPGHNPSHPENKEPEIIPA